MSLGVLGQTVGGGYTCLLAQWHLLEPFLLTFDLGEWIRLPRKMLSA